LIEGGLDRERPACSLERRHATAARASRFPTTRPGCSRTSTGQLASSATSRAMRWLSHRAQALAADRGGTSAPRTRRCGRRGRRDPRMARRARPQIRSPARHRAARRACHRTRHRRGAVSSLTRRELSAADGRSAHVFGCRRAVSAAHSSRRTAHRTRCPRFRPNGLAAASTIARAGFAVESSKRRDTRGGWSHGGADACRAMRHDVCSSVHPLAAASPSFAASPRADSAAPAGGRLRPPAGPAVARQPVFGSVADTAETSARTPAAYRRLMGPLVEHADQIIPRRSGRSARCRCRRSRWRASARWGYSRPSACGALSQRPRRRATFGGLCRAQQSSRSPTH